MLWAGCFFFGPFWCSRILRYETVYVWSCMDFKLLTELKTSCFSGCTSFRAFSAFVHFEPHCRFHSIWKHSEIRIWAIKRNHHSVFLTWFVLFLNSHFLGAFKAWCRIFQGQFCMRRNTWQDTCKYWYRLKRLSSYVCIN